MPLSLSKLWLSIGFQRQWRIVQGRWLSRGRRRELPLGPSWGLSSACSLNLQCVGNLYVVISSEYSERSRDRCDRAAAGNLAVDVTIVLWRNRVSSAGQGGNDRVHSRWIVADKKPITIVLLLPGTGRPNSVFWILSRIGPREIVLF